MRLADAANIVQQKEKLAMKVKTLTNGYSCLNRHRTSTVAWIKIISSFSCERRIIQILRNNELAKETCKFDSYYRQKSEFATINILEHVKTRLSSNGLEASILTESSSDIGRYDIVVAAGCNRTTNADCEGKVRIEIKASLGLDFEQIGRYLWDSSPLILVRVITGHVAKIKPSELQSYVTFSLEELDSKVDRLLSNNLYAIPGIACTTCSDNNCIYWRKLSKSTKLMNVVTLPDTEFAEDLTSFFRNLSYVAERTAIMVIEELKGVPPRQNQVFSIPTQL